MNVIEAKIPDTPEMAAAREATEKMIETFMAQPMAIIGQLLQQVAGAKLASRFGQDPIPDEILQVSVRLSDAVSRVNPLIRGVSEEGLKRVSLEYQLIHLRSNFVVLAARLQSLMMDLHVSQIEG